VPLAGLKQLDFGGWDIFEDNAYEAAKNAHVLNPELLLKLKPSLEKITPMKAVFDRRYVTRIDGPNVKNKGSLRDKAGALIEDIAAFKKRHQCDRLVMIWCGSAEIFCEPGQVH